VKHANGTHAVQEWNEFRSDLVSFLRRKGFGKSYNAVAGATMRGTTAIPPYTLLAEHYDDLFWSYQPLGQAAREQILRQILPKVASACDLACGTGTSAIALARAGIKMQAVDISPTMCALARKKVRLARLNVPVLNADMRSFRLPEPVDLVTCEFDAINHLPRKADLARVIKAVARTLRPGGYFYFDVNNRLSFEKVWGRDWWIEKPGIALIMHGGHDHDCQKAYTDVEWFILKGSSWRRFRERVEEVCWTAAEIRSTLRQAGFEQVRSWDAKPFFREIRHIRRGFRTFYLARKSR
jgi:SAM-dependent methyltransferase